MTCPSTKAFSTKSRNEKTFDVGNGRRSGPTSGSSRAPRRRGAGWLYYKIPQGTVLPRGLAVVKDAYNEQMQATHYTIAPAHEMPVVLFKLLLDQLAANALRESA